jgi:hypothetical protein
VHTMSLLAHLAALPIQLPDPPPAPPPGLEKAAGQVVSWLKWGVRLSALIGFSVCAIMLIIGRRNRSALAYEGMAGSAWVIAGLALGSAAVLIVGAFL